MDKHGAGRKVHPNYQPVTVAPDVKDVTAIPGVLSHIVVPNNIRVSGPVAFLHEDVPSTQGLFRIRVLFPKPRNSF